MNATTNHPMVRFEGVTKRYGALTVLDDLNLEIGRGEKVAIIGPSGSGKTTVLRMLMTLERIDGGVIWVDGEPMTHMQKNGSMVPAEPRHLRRVRSKIGMVFQHFNLFPHMTALGNVMSGPVYALGKSQGEAETTARTLLDRVGLLDKAASKPSQLSGGQQQRVAIARALAVNPAAILFDEPTSALDPKMSAEVMRVIDDLADDEQLQTTMVIVSHDVAALRKVADVIVVLERGQVAYAGPTMEVPGEYLA